MFLTIKLESDRPERRSCKTDGLCRICKQNFQAPLAIDCIDSAPDGLKKSPRIEKYLSQVWFKTKVSGVLLPKTDIFRIEGVDESVQVVSLKQNAYACFSGFCVRHFFAESQRPAQPIRAAIEAKMENTPTAAESTPKAGGRNT